MLKKLESVIELDFFKKMNQTGSWPIPSLFWIGKFSKITHVFFYENWFLNDNKIKIKDNIEVNLFVKLYLTIKYGILKQFL